MQVEKIFTAVVALYSFVLQTGEVSHVTQTPLASDDHRRDWKCSVEYFCGEKKEFILPSPSLKVRLSTKEAMEGVKNLKPQRFLGESFNYLSYNTILSILIVFLIGNIQGTASFEMVKLNIKNLLTQRGREDLIPTWEKFLSQFPRAEIDANVPCDDIYEELLRSSEEAKR